MNKSDLVEKLAYYKTFEIKLVISILLIAGSAAFLELNFKGDAFENIFKRSVDIATIIGIGIALRQFHDSIESSKRSKIAADENTRATELSSIKSSLEFMISKLVEGPISKFRYRSAVLAETFFGQEAVQIMLMEMYYNINSNNQTSITYISTNNLNIIQYMGGLSAVTSICLDAFDDHIDDLRFYMLPVKLELVQADAYVLPLCRLLKKSKYISDEDYSQIENFYTASKIKGLKLDLKDCKFKKTIYKVSVSRRAWINKHV